MGQINRKSNPKSNKLDESLKSNRSKELLTQQHRKKAKKAVELLSDPLTNPTAIGSNKTAIEQAIKNNPNHSENIDHVNVNIIDVLVTPTQVEGGQAHYLLDQLNMLDNIHPDDPLWLDVLQGIKDANNQNKLSISHKETIFKIIKRNEYKFSKPKIDPTEVRILIAGIGLFAVSSTLSAISLLGSVTVALPFVVASFTLGGFLFKDYAEKNTIYKESTELVKNTLSAMQGDKDFILEVVKNDGRALVYASDNLKADPEVVKAAMKQDVRALQFASEELKADKNFILAAVNDS